MSTIAYLEAYVGADITSFRRGMAQVRGEIAATTGLGSSLQTLGASLTTALSLPLAAIGGIGLKSFVDLDAQMRNVNSIAGLSEEQFQDLTRRVMDFGSETRKGADEAALSLYTIVSAGYGLNDINEAFNVMAVATKTAEAGLSDTEITTQALVSGLLAYNETSDKAAAYSDALTRAVAVGVGTMEQFAGSVGLVLPTSAALNVSWQELLATSAFLTQRGLSPSEAFVSLNGLMRKLIDPSDKMVEVFGQLGVASGTELIQKFGSLEGALGAIRNIVGDNAEVWGELFTEIRAFRGATSIINNFDKFTETMDEFGGAVDGATDRAQQEQLKSFASQWDHMISAIQSGLNEIGQRLAPALGVITDFIGRLALEFKNLSPETLDNVVKIGLLVAALPPLIWLLGALMSPIGLIIGALVLLKKAFDDNFLGIQALWENVFKPKLEMLPHQIYKILYDVGVYASVAWWYISDIFHKFIEDDLSHLLYDVFIGDWEAAQEDLSNIWTDIQEAFWDRLAKPLGDALAGLGEHNFSAIALGIVAIAGAVTVFGAALLLFNLPTLISAITTALIALVTTGLAPFIIVAGLAALAVLAYVNNWGGFADFINNTVRPALEFIIDAFNEILYLGREIGNMLSGQAWERPGTTQLAPGQTPGDWFMEQARQNLPFGMLPREEQAQIPLIAPKPNIMNRLSPLDVQSFNKAAGYGSSNSSQTNTFNIYTNDADKLMNDLRNKGVDLKKARKG